ncbi:HEPN domain-containing protein [bacterium]|nr:HEPN domain-containing protein [bacterium]
MTFDVSKTINYWVESAEYDLETGRRLLDSERFPYALFFGHLSLEKILKALVVKNTEHHAPHTPSLIQLANKSKIKIPDVTLDKLAEYMEFHIESRYPDENHDFYNKCTEEFTREKLSEIEEIYAWLILKLKE